MVFKGGCWSPNSYYFQKWLPNSRQAHRWEDQIGSGAGRRMRRNNKRWPSHTKKTSTRRKQPCTHQTEVHLWVFSDQEVEKERTPPEQISSWQKSWSQLTSSEKLSLCIHLDVKKKTFYLQIIAFVSTLSSDGYFIVWLMHWREDNSKFSCRLHFYFEARCHNKIV